MSSPPNPVSLRFPFELKGVPEEVAQAHRYAFQGLLDANQAIASLSSQIRLLKPSTPTVTGSASSVTINPSGGTSLSGLGAIRDLTGSTTYTTITSDNGILLLLSDASPVAVSLDSAMTTPYFLFASNAGAGLVTFTPTSGTINGAATYTLATGYLAIIIFDGTNWKTSAVLVIPQNTPAVATEFITAYNSATGAFTQAQPAFTDISGQITTSQLPASGISATITTAALTTLGTQGSMTFTNGILTAQVQAT